MSKFQGPNTGKNHWTNVAVMRLMHDLTAQPVTNIVLSEGRVYGSRYYCAEPIGGHWLEMQEWAQGIFGKAGDRIWDSEHDRNVFAPEADARWYMNNRKFWFRNEKDRIMFILRWS